MRLQTLLLALLLSSPALATEVQLKPVTVPAPQGCTETIYTQGTIVTRTSNEAYEIADYQQPEEPEQKAKLLEEPSTTDNYESHEIKKGVNYQVVHKPANKDGTLLWAGKTLGRGVLHFVTHTTRFSLGCLAVQYWGHAANEATGTAAYTVVLHYTGNPWIANAAYHLGKDTLAPVTLSILFYVAAHTPDLLYFTVKGTWYALKLTYEGGRLFIKATSETYRVLSGLRNSANGWDGAIEMAPVGKPHALLKLEG